MCSSLDGFVSTVEGLPIQLAFPGWDPSALGFYEFQSRCDAVLMGRTTFEPALGAPSWPWGDLRVYVLGSHRPAGTPDSVVVETDPIRLLERVRADTSGGDVHLVGGPRTIETFRRLDAVDELRFLVLPMIAGAGRALSSDVDSTIGLTFLESTTWPAGVVELTYRVESVGADQAGNPSSDHRVLSTGIDVMKPASINRTARWCCREVNARSETGSSTNREAPQAAHDLAWLPSAFVGFVSLEIARLLRHRDLACRC